MLHIRDLYVLSVYVGWCWMMSFIIIRVCVEDHGSHMLDIEYLACQTS